MFNILKKLNLKKKNNFLLKKKKGYTLIEMLIVILIIGIIAAGFAFYRPSAIGNTPLYEVLETYKENIFNPTYYKVNENVPKTLRVEIIPQKKIISYITYKKADGSEEEKIWKKESFIISGFEIDNHNFKTSDQKLEIIIDFGGKLENLENKIKVLLNGIEYNCKICPLTFKHIIIDVLGNKGGKVMIKDNFHIIQL